MSVDEVWHTFIILWNWCNFTTAEIHCHF
jgi:hypothetical protein